MKILIALFVCCMSFVPTAVAEDEAKISGHEIPKNSKSEWDFRGKVSPFLGSSKTAKKLPECKTYEELRDRLKIAFKELYESNA